MFVSKKSLLFEFSATRQKKAVFSRQDVVWRPTAFGQIWVLVLKAWYIRAFQTQYSDSDTSLKHT